MMDSMRPTAWILTLAVFAPAARADDAALRRAVERGLRRIEAGAAAYPKHRQCFSCHHQALPLLTLTAARRRGFPVEPAKVNREVDFTQASFQKKDRIRQGQGVGNGNTQAGYALAALDAAGHRADDTTAALVEYLLVRQRPDGSWPALNQRPPAEGNPFTNAAWALHALRVYGRPVTALRERVERARGRAGEWLRRHQAEDTEGRAFRLRGLVEVQAPADELRKARTELLHEQREDGSWSQLPGRAGDAYATGSVLVALARAGLPVTDAAYRKGVRYLLATQKADGAWLVGTRSRPLQTFFDNGDPGGKSQFISFLATNWAVLALLQVYPEQ
jgi:N-acyl-D-amino-acid deacylase